ncbi:MAG: hypothetical protein R3F11_18005 [Verrucomicrobiales bacterium]
MFRKLFIALWIIAPAGLLAFHYGPGQKAMQQDELAAAIKRAQEAKASEDWVSAVQAYQTALGLAPAENTELRARLQLAAADARIYTGQLPEAMADMQGLMDELEQSGAAQELIDETRGELSAARYYAGWLIRLEGGEKDDWMPQVDAARQGFRLLAESAEAKGDAKSAEEHQKNLESAIRLARMDLSELKALPLPKKCQGCKNCCSKCQGQKKSRNEGKKPEKKEDARGAGKMDRPEGSGS